MLGLANTKPRSNAYVDSWTSLSGFSEYSIHQMDRQDLEIIQECLSAKIERLNARIEIRSKNLGAPGNSSLLKDLSIRKHRIQSLLMKIKKKLNAEAVKT